jgi:hypothetical protein
MPAEVAHRTRLESVSVLHHAAVSPPIKRSRSMDQSLPTDTHRPHTWPVVYAAEDTEQGGGLPSAHAVSWNRMHTVCQAGDGWRVMGKSVRHCPPGGRPPDRASWERESSTH